MRRRHAISFGHYRDLDMSSLAAAHPAHSPLLLPSKALPAESHGLFEAFGKVLIKVLMLDMPVPVPMARHPPPPSHTLVHGFISCPLIGKCSSKYVALELFNFGGTRCYRGSRCSLCCACVAPSLPPPRRPRRASSSYCTTNTCPELG